MESHTGNIMILSNSIIGVSILAMPFCFKQCGIILAILMLGMSSIITRLTCHFLLKSAIISRRRTFELLAFHTFGTTGKFMVELGIIGFLMGTCIAFFVIIGDLGPTIIAKIMGITPTDTLRTSILIGMAVFCVFPLGLLRNVDSLHRVSTATIGFYFCLILKTISESATHFISGNWLTNVELWRPVGVLQCLPIFAMALSCQTQLFEIYETVPNPTLEKMNYIVRVAINICVAVYMCVGFFGYAAFASESFTGNILMSFNPSPVTDAMKIGFVLSVAFSFPLVIFPCRASLYSLLFKKGYTPYEGASNYIPEFKFKLLTFIIVATSLGIGIIIPNIEVVLGLLGSTIGTMICLIFPVTCFICITTKNTNERLTAQFLLFVGVIVMVLGTYANLYAMEQINDPINAKEKIIVIDNENIINSVQQNIFAPLPKEDKIVPEIKLEAPKVQPPIILRDEAKETRLEPPQPVEPQDEKKKEVVVVEQKIDKQKEEEKGKDEQNAKKLVVSLSSNIPEIAQTKADEVNIDAIKKEDNELKEEEKNKPKSDDKAKEANLMKTIEQYQEEQKKLLKEQKELIEQQKIEKEKAEEVRRKTADKILEIAIKAIEELAPKPGEEINILNKGIGNSKENDDLVMPVKEENEVNKLVDADKKPEKSKNATNSVRKNMIPLPMVGNKSLSEILYNKVPEKENNTLALVQEMKGVPNILNDIIAQHPRQIAEKKEHKNDENNEVVKVNDELKNNVVTETVHIEKKLEDKNKESLSLPKRDILATEEKTEADNTVRLKREAADSRNEKENCEATEKNRNGELESIPINVNDLNLKPNLIEDALKLHLSAASFHLKRKRK